VHHVRQMTIGLLLLATIFGGVWALRNSSDSVYSISKSPPGVTQQGNSSDIPAEDSASGDAQSDDYGSQSGDRRVLAQASPAGTPSRTVSPSATPAAKPRTAPITRKPAPTAQQPAPPPPPAVPADEAAKTRVVELVNAERAKAGCSAVHSDSRLAAAAQGHSEDMARRNYFSHTTPEGVDPWERARAAGYNTPTGENIAMGQRTAEDVVTGWMNSSGHRANILNCDSHAIGMGLGRNAEGTPYWTQMFGSV